MCLGVQFSTVSVQLSLQCTMSNCQCTMYNEHWTLQCTLNYVHCTMNTDNVHCTVYTTLYNVHCTMNNVHSTLNFNQCSGSGSGSVDPGLFSWIRIRLFPDPDADPIIWQFEWIPGQIWGDLDSYFLKIRQAVQKLWIFCHGSKFWPKNRNFWPIWWCYSYFWRWNRPKL